MSWQHQTLWHAWKHWFAQKRAPEIFLPALPEPPYTSQILTPMFMYSAIWPPSPRKNEAWLKLCIGWSNFQPNCSSTCQVNFGQIVSGPPLCVSTLSFGKRHFRESSKYFTLAWKLLWGSREPVGNPDTDWWWKFINRAEHLTPSTTSWEWLKNQHIQYVIGLWSVARTEKWNL